MLMKVGLLVAGYFGTEAAGSEAEGQAEAKRPAGFGVRHVAGSDVV